MSVKEILQETVSNTKVAVVVSTSTAGTSLGTLLAWIPNEVGKLGTLVGIILSLVLIYTHWRRGRIEYEKTKLEIAILREQAERLAAEDIE